MNDDLYGALSERLRGEILQDEPMARHTSLKVGGPADFFVIPADRGDLETLLALLAETATPHFVVGGGYNLLVRDGGIRGVVVSLERFRELTHISGGKVSVGAGVTNQMLVGYLKERGLGGLEFLCGIPGTIGGALAMNAGAQGGAILEHVEELITLRDGTSRQVRRDELEYGYRYLRLAPGEIIAGATFRLEPDDPDKIGNRIAGYLAHRAESQKVGYPNAGSFFKNPEGGAAWRLIDGAGLRGTRIGGAQVSEVHANFLINRGDATAADFLALSALIKDEVRRNTGISLEEEVRIVGEE